MDPHKRRLERCVIISCVAGERGYPRKSRMRNRIPRDAPPAVADTIFYELSFLQVSRACEKRKNASTFGGCSLRLC